MGKRKAKTAQAVQKKKLDAFDDEKTKRKDGEKAWQRLKQL